MQKKLILSLLLAALILGLGLFAYKQYSRSQLTGPISTYTQDAGVRRSSSSGIDGNPRAEAAWSALLSYTQAAKDHNITALKKLAYKVSAACLDPDQAKICNERMDRASEITGAFKKSDFKNVVFDDRQIVLSTDWVVKETDIAIGETREVIYFARDKNGYPKLIYFTQPEEIVYSFIDPTQTKTALVNRLKERIVDTDGDLLADEVETCTFESADPKTCTKTDPKKIDTDGDGWWDSVEQYIK